MSDNIRAIYARQSIQTLKNGASICHSALLSCDHGNKTCILNLKSSHGKYVGNCAQIDAKDGKDATFGYCDILSGPCQGSQSDWYNENTGDVMFDENTLTMEASVPQNEAFRLCSAGGVIKADTDGQNVLEKKIKCLDPAQEYKEEIVYVHPVQSEIWYKFDTNADHCGTFKISLWYDKSTNISSESPSLYIYPIFFIEVYEKLFINMRLVDEFRLDLSDATNYIFTVRLDLKYDETFYFRFKCSGFDQMSFYHKIQGNVDRTTLPMAVWTRITPDICFPKPYSSYKYLSYYCYLYEKIMRFDEKATTILYNSLHIINDAFGIKDEGERLSALKRSCTAGMEDIALQQDVQDYIEMVITNGSATILSIPLPNAYSVIGSFAISMLVSILDNKFQEGMTRQSLTSRIFEKGEIIQKGEYIVANKPITLIFKTLFYLNKGSIDLMDVLDIEKLEGGENDHEFPKYYHGAIHASLDKEQMSVGSLLTPSDIQAIWRHMSDG